MAAPEVPSSHKYLLDAPTLTLATIDPNGRPQLSQIWFLAEDGVVKTGLNTLRQKVKNLEANPHATVFILDTANPQKYLEIRGDVTIEPDPDYEFTERMVAKYGSPPIREWDGPDGKRVKVTLNAVRINAVDMSGGEPTDS
jgi:PPOX class probable F420-dependent enzyme